MDVKTKDRNCFAEPHYTASVEARQRSFDCDWYAFFNYNKSERVMQWMGWYRKSDYFLDAKKANKGDVDTQNFWTVSADCYQLEYGHLQKGRHQ